MNRKTYMKKKGKSINITIYNTIKILITASIIASFFLYKQLLLPLISILILLYFISRSSKFRLFEKENETKISRFDGILSIIVVVLTIVGVLISPSQRNNPIFDIDEMRQRLEDAGFTNDEIDERLSKFENIDELESNKKTKDIFSLLTESNTRASRPSNDGNVPLGGGGRGARILEGIDVVPEINLSSVISFINKGLVLTIGFVGLIVAFKTKTSYD